MNRSAAKNCVAVTNNDIRRTRLQLSSKEALLRAQSEHKKLIKLCKDGRTKDACALLVSHIEAVRADLVQIISAL